MRLTASISAITSLLIAQTAFAAEAPSHGGFIGVTGALVTTDDVDGYNSAFKLVFGPNITENLALEFGVMDFGEISFDDPELSFTDNEDNAPVFSNAENGSIESFSGTETSGGNATYVGTESFKAQSILLNLRYNYALSDSLDLFVKGGANAWMAQVEKVRIYADNGTQTFTRSGAGSNETSGVELITGIGVMWQPIGGLNVRAEIESTSLDSFYVEPSEFMLYALGIQYEF